MNARTRQAPSHAGQQRAKSTLNAKTATTSPPVCTVVVTGASSSSYAPSCLRPIVAVDDGLDCELLVLLSAAWTAATSANTTTVAIQRLDIVAALARDHSSPGDSVRLVETH